MQQSAYIYIYIKDTKLHSFSTKECTHPLTLTRVISNEYSAVCIRDTKSHVAPHNTHELHVMCTLRDVRAIRKQEKSALLPQTRVKNALPWPDIKTAANIHHRCRYCTSDNVAFTKENVSETSESIKNWQITWRRKFPSTLDLSIFDCKIWGGLVRFPHYTEGGGESS